MKILFVHRYFWPDSPPYASLLRTMAEHLADEGHDVHVMTAQPSYGGSDQHVSSPTRETLGSVNISRARLFAEKPTQMARRAANLGLFAAQVFGHIVKRRDYDVVMAATTPPILIALAGRLASQTIGAKFVYHMQDIYPEVMSANQGQSLGLSHRVLRRVDSWTTKHADRVVVLSRDMANTIGKRHDASNVRVINNFLPDSSHQGESLPLGTTSWKTSSRQVVFAGNLGNFQGLGAVIDAFAILRERGVPVHLVLLGSGVAEDDLQLRARAMVGDTVFFPGRVSQAESEAVVAASDIALVTLNAGVIETAFPSKIMTYLSCGTPVLAAVEATSELAEMLDHEGVGAACDLTPVSIADGVVSMLSAERIDSSVIVSVASGYASAASRLPQWSSLMSELDSELDD